MNSLCTCAGLPQALKVDQGARHLRKLPQVASKSHGWLTLVRCPDCCQHWQLDRWDKLQVALAVKVASPEEWLGWDDKDHRLAFLIDSRGGLGDEPCTWRGCANKALEDMAFCPLCAYDRMGQRD